MGIKGRGQSGVSAPVNVERLGENSIIRITRNHSRVCELRGLCRPPRHGSPQVGLSFPRAGAVSLAKTPASNQQIILTANQGPSTPPNNQATNLSDSHIQQPSHPPRLNPAPPHLPTLQIQRLTFQPRPCIFGAQQRPLFCIFDASAFSWRQLPARPQGAPTSCKDCMLQRVCHCS
jgi:hypothetical protein